MRSPIKPLASRAGLAAVAGMALVVGATPLLASAADHLDAPAAKADHRVDITDVYAFKAGAGHTTLVLNVDGLMTPADSKVATFRANALYELKVDRNQDGKADLAYRVRFSPASTNADGTRTQKYVVRRATGAMANEQRVERQGRRRPAAPPPTSTASAPRTSCTADRCSPAPATTRSSSTSRASSSSRTSCSAARPTSATLLGGFTGDRHVRGHQRALDRDPAAERQARRHRQLDRRLRDHLRSVERRLEAGRPHGPAGDQHRVQRADPAGTLRLQRPGEGRLQLPAPGAGRRDHDRQRHDRAQRDRQRADREQRRRRTRRARSSAIASRAAAGRADADARQRRAVRHRARRSARSRSTAGGCPTTSSTPSSRCSPTS